MKPTTMEDGGLPSDTNDTEMSEETTPVKYRILDGTARNQTLTRFKQSTTSGLRMHVLKGTMFHDNEEGMSDTESVYPIMLTHPRNHLKNNHQTLTRFKQSTTSNLRKHVIKGVRFDEYEEDMSDIESVCSSQSTPAILTRPRIHLRNNNQTLTRHKHSTTSGLRMHVLKGVRFNEHEEDMSDTESVCSSQSAPIMLTDPRNHLKNNIPFKLNRRKMEQNTVKPLFTKIAPPSINVELESEENDMSSTPPQQRRLLNTRRTMSNSNLAAYDLAGNTSDELRRASSINLPPIVRSPFEPHKTKLNSSMPIPANATTSRSHESLVENRTKIEKLSQESRHNQKHHMSPCKRCLHRNSSITSILAQTFGQHHQIPVQDQRATIVDELLHIDEMRRFSDKGRADGKSNGNANSQTTNSKSLADMFGELQDCRYLRKPNHKEAK